MKKIISLLFIVVGVITAQSGSSKSVLEYGAIPDGKTLNTLAIQKAVDEASANGGTVIFPAGKYLTGSIELKSNVDIYLTNGALILGSTNISDYKERIPKLRSYNDLFLKHSLFYAEKAENIFIYGSGIIDGQGSNFVVNTKEKPARYKNRPFVLRFVECKNIRVENVTLQNSAMWMQQYLACENLFIRGINVINHANQNNDMMDIDGCKNVVVSDCIGDTDDDGITIKSTSAFISENITITNCVISSHCNAIKLGTESHGGFKNITISNIVVKPSFDTEPIFGKPKGISGITLGMVDGGILEGVTISNIIIDGTHVPIYLRLGNRARKYYDEQSQPGVGEFKDVMISNVIAKNVQSPIGCSITGIPGNTIKNISLNNISIELPGGGTIEDAKKTIPELEDHYPESTKWGNLPAYGMFIRHAQNININNMELKLKSDDLRPAVICDHVQHLDLNGLKIVSNKNAESAISFVNVVDGSIRFSSVQSNADTFLEVKGDKSSNIYVLNNLLKNAKKIITNKSKSKITESGNIR